jgi:uncharacterized membrane protein
MAPLIILITVTAVARVLGWSIAPALDSWSAATAVGAGIMFLFTAGTHFIQPRKAGLISIVPPVVPRPDLAVTATGVLEGLGAIGLLVPSTRSAAAICLAALLLFLFPANVHASRARRHAAAPMTPLGRRTAIQLVFITACIYVAFGTV